MAQRKRGTSPHSKYRHARQRVAELEAQQATLERSRPRTPGKKGAKTRALNGLAHQLRSARGLLTKARNAIAKASSARAVAKREASAKRSAAAKKGWATRRSRAKVVTPAALTKPAITSLANFMPFLTTSGVSDRAGRRVAESGVIDVNPIGNHDRSLVGRYWTRGVRPYLDTGRTDALESFEGRNILDAETGKRLPFVTDPNVILEHEAEFDFGVTGFYKRREEVTRFAA